MTIRMYSVARRRRRRGDRQLVRRARQHVDVAGRARHLDGLGPVPQLGPHLRQPRRARRWASTAPPCPRRSARVVGLAFLARRVLAPLGHGYRRPRARRAAASTSRCASSWRVIRFGLPNGLNWFVEFAAFQLFVNVVFAALGDDTLAALNVVIAINSVVVHARVRPRVRRRDPRRPGDRQRQQGRGLAAGQAHARGLRRRGWARSASSTSSRPRPLLQLFDSDRVAHRCSSPSASTMLLISAAWQLFDAIGITLSETLRAAGDTTWTAAARLAPRVGRVRPARLPRGQALGRRPGRRDAVPRRLPRAAGRRSSPTASAPARGATSSSSSPSSSSASALRHRRRRRRRTRRHRACRGCRTCRCTPSDVTKRLHAVRALELRHVHRRPTCRARPGSPRAGRGARRSRA